MAKQQEKEQSLSPQAQAIAKKLPETWQDIAQQFEVVDIREVVPGYSLEQDKENLIGKPFIIVDWTFRDSDKVFTVDPTTKQRVAKQYVSLNLIVKDTNERLVINDGGTGIFEQMLGIAEKVGGQNKAVYVPKGLRKSEYEFEKDGQAGEAVTYYLAL
jgi:hypothetical protein